MKKGFTLIELLAVIVILAILALIVAPIISGVITNAKDESNKRSVEGLVKSAEYYVVNQQLSKTVSKSENIYDKLTVSGKKPDRAEVYADDYHIAVAAVFGDKCYSKKYNGDEVVSSKLSGSGICTIYGAETDETCFVYESNSDTEFEYNYHYNLDNLVVNNIDYCENNIYDIDNPELICNGGTMVVEGNNVSLKDYVQFELGYFNITSDTGVITQSTLNSINNWFKNIGVDNPFEVTVILSGGESKLKITEYKCGGIQTELDYNDNKSDMILNIFKYKNLYEERIIKDVVIPSSINGIEVEAIGEDAFMGYYLTGVVIPPTVKTIGNYAFALNELEDFIFPNSITSIGDNAFYGNYLTNVTIPPLVTVIGSGLFMYNKLTNVVIPNGVTTIESYAFYGNNLTNVTISSTVSSIEYEAFSKRKNNYRDQSNISLTTINNLSNNSLDWGNAINGISGYKFIKGTVVNDLGDVTINHD